MNISAWRQHHEGPFRSHQIADGDSYELTHGHPVPCLPRDPSSTSLRLAVTHMLAADPVVEWAAIGLGFSPEPKTLRALDVMIWSRLESAGTAKAPRLPERERRRLATALLLASDPAVEWVETASESVPGPRTLGRHGDEGDGQGPGWISEAPPLVIVLGDENGDAEDLDQKVRDLMAGGVRVAWVARFDGPRRVEVHVPARPVRRIPVETDLTATGILGRPVPALALFDREVALTQAMSRLDERS